VLDPQDVVVGLNGGDDLLGSDVRHGPTPSARGRRIG
jgi:hypothetical protein